MGASPCLCKFASISTHSQQHSKGGSLICTLLPGWQARVRHRGSCVNACNCVQSPNLKKKVTVCNECRAWQVLHDYPSSCCSATLDVARMVEKLWAHLIDKRKDSSTRSYNAHLAPTGASHAPRSCSLSCLRLTSWLSTHVVGWIIFLLKKLIFSFHGNDIPSSLEYNHHLILQLNGWGLCGFGWRGVHWPLCRLISVLWRGVIVGEGQAERQADRQVWKAAGRQNRKVHRLVVLSHEYYKCTGCSLSLAVTSLSKAVSLPYICTLQNFLHVHTHTLWPLTFDEGIWMHTVMVSHLVM